jgi:hypothetical protein
MNDEDFDSTEDELNSDTLPVRLPAMSKAVGTEELHNPDVIPGLDISTEKHFVNVSLPVTFGQVQEILNIPESHVTKYVEKILKSYNCNLTDLKTNTYNPLTFYKEKGIPLIHSIEIDPARAQERVILVESLDRCLLKYEELINTCLDNLKNYESISKEASEEQAFELLKAQIIEIRKFEENFIFVEREIIKLSSEADKSGFGLALFSRHALQNMMANVGSLNYRKYMDPNDVQAENFIKDATTMLGSRIFLSRQFKSTRWAIGPRSIQSQLAYSNLPINWMDLSDDLSEFTPHIPSGLFAESLIEIFSNIKKYGGTNVIIEGSVITNENGDKSMRLEFTQFNALGKRNPETTSGAGLLLLRAMGLDVKYSDLDNGFGGVTTLEIPVLVLVEA